MNGVTFCSLLLCNASLCESTDICIISLHCTVAEVNVNETSLRFQQRVWEFNHLSDAGLRSPSWKRGSVAGPLWAEVAREPRGIAADVLCAAAMNHWETLPLSQTWAFCRCTFIEQHRLDRKLLLESLVWCKVQRQSQPSRLHWNLIYLLCLQPYDAVNVFGLIHLNHSSNWQSKSCW